MSGQDNVSGQDDREIQYAGRPVVIRGGDAPVRAWRGFFSGDDYDVHHVEASGAAASEDTPSPQPHPGDIAVEFDGQVFDLHRTAVGDIHSHDLPFMSFTSVDEAALTVARFVDLGVLHGRPEEPEQT